MATELKEMPKVKRPGRTPAHPYDEWFERAGKSPLELVRGEDFTSELKTMRHNLYRHLRERNLKGETVAVVKDNGKETIALRIVGKRTNKDKK